MNKGNKFYCLEIVLFLLFVLIGNGFPVFPQSGLEMSVSGFVRDVNTKIPIPGVEIIIARFEQGNFTDIFTEKSNKNGFFMVRYLQAGNYIFRIKSPENMTLGSTLEPKNFDQLVIKEGINVNLNVFLGESEIPSFEKSVPIDGSTIMVKILYNKTLYQEIDELIKKEKLGLIDKAFEDSTGYGGLIILDPKIIYVEDDFVIMDSDGDICDSAIAYGYPRIEYYKIFCNKDEPGGECYCSFIGLKCYIETSIYFHKTTYWGKKYPNAIDECIQCIMNCAEDHEGIHKKLMNEFIQDQWNSLKNKLKEKLSYLCCDDSKFCEDVCGKKLEIERLELIEAIFKNAPKTETIATEATKKCITSECNKIKSCENVKY